MVLCVEKITDNPENRQISEVMQDGVLVQRMVITYSQGKEQFRERYHNQQVDAALAQAIHAWKPDVIHLFSGYLMGLGVIETARAHNVPVIVSLTDYWWLCHRINLVRADGERCAGPHPYGCARCAINTRRAFRLPDQFFGHLSDLLWQTMERKDLLHAKLQIEEHERRQQLLRDTLNKANLLISPSRYLASVYVEHGIDGALIQVMRQGVARDSFPIRRESELFRFSYFGQVKHHKGVHTIISAWTKLTGDRPRRLTIYGSHDGEERYATNLQRQTREMPDVHWRGKIPHAAVWNELADTDVTIIASRWAENSPNIVLEAQAMNVPIIGANLGGVAEVVVNNWNGLLFQPDDADDLARCMQSLLDQPEVLHTLREHSMPTAHVFEEIDTLENIYHQLATTAQDPGEISVRTSTHSGRREADWLQGAAHNLNPEDVG